MQARSLLLALGILAPLAGTPPAAAQVPEPGAAVRNPLWVNVGLAADASGDHLGMAAGLNFMTARDHVVTIRAMYLEEFQLCIFGPCTGEPDTRIEGAVLYGLGTASRWWGASISAGLGLIGGQVTRYREPMLAQEGFVTVGLPVEAQIYFRPIPQLGIGMSGIANLNGTDSLTGIVLGMQFGRLVRQVAH